MLQIVFNKISAAEVSSIPTLEQLDLLGDFQVSESTLQTLDDARFGKMEKDGKILYRYVAKDYRIYFEVIEGKWILSYSPKKKLPIEDFLRTQGRFKHLFKPENEHLLVQYQEEVDRRWEDLLFRCSKN